VTNQKIYGKFWLESLKLLLLVIMKKKNVFFSWRSLPKKDVKFFIVIKKKSIPMDALLVVE
jgi:hypothetical protein